MVCYTPVNSDIFLHKLYFIGVGVISSVMAVVVGHWAQNAELSPQHFTRRAHNFLQFKDDDNCTVPGSATGTHSSVDLMKSIFDLFS